ncbi:hypothetical protein MPSEU_000127400 [Mayamaea pseudoterrestris]|nr:hypothetical protein MPSEU_000127400 [Mayamaea pseudoterrestris]
MLTWLYTKVFGGGTATAGKQHAQLQSPTNKNEEDGSPSTESAAAAAAAEDPSSKVTSPTKLALNQDKMHSGPDSPKTEPESASDSSTGGEAESSNEGNTDDDEPTNGKRSGESTELPQIAKKQKVIINEDETGNNSDWDEMYARLEEFQKEHGHTCVPSQYEDAELVAWMKAQRDAWSQRNEGKITDLTDDRIEKLNKLNFEWSFEQANRSDGI